MNKSTEQVSGKEVCLVCDKGILREDAPFVTDDYMIRVRPRYPWEEWTSKASVAGGAENEICHEADITMKETSSNLGKTPAKLNAFFSKIESQDEKRYPRDINCRILMHVRTEVENLCTKLAEKHPETFAESMAHLVGSAGEGSKLGLFDEFDFMIELPALTKRDYTLKEFSRLATDMKEKINLQFFSSLPPCWKYFKKPWEHPNRTNIVVSISVPPDGVYVFCDIVFCLGIANSIRSTKCVFCGRKPTRSNVYLIGPNSLTFGLFSSVEQSFTFTEFDNMLKYAASDKVRRVYRLAKLLIRDCLPPYYDTERFAFGTAIPSYCLKQIIFFMMDEFPDTEFWHEKYLGLRVLQVMSWLNVCIQKKNISKYFDPMVCFNDQFVNSISTKYFPGLWKLLQQASGGDKSALDSLTVLPAVMSRFKDTLTVREDVMLAGLNCVIDGFRSYRDPRYTTENPYKVILREYIHRYMKKEIYLSEENLELLIVYKDDFYSLDDFQEQYLGIYNEEAFREDSKELPREWEKLYDDMLKDSIRRDLRQGNTSMLYTLLCCWKCRKKTNQDKERIR